MNRTLARIDWLLGIPFVWTGNYLWYRKLGYGRRMAGKKAAWKVGL